MIAPAIEAVQTMARKAGEEARVRVFQVPQEPSDVYCLESGDANGVRTVARVIAEPKPRRYRATTLSGFLQLVQGFEQDLGIGSPDEEKVAGLKKTGGITVFVSRGKITAVMGEKERRHTAEFMFECTDAFDLLHDMEANPAVVEQSKMLWLFKTTFAGKVGPPGTIASLKMLRWKSRDDASQSVGVGKSGLGADVEREVLAGGGEIPEELVITTHVYEGVEELREIPASVLPFKVAFDVDYDKRQFVLKTLPDQCVAAMNHTDQLIADFLINGLHTDVRVVVGGVFNP